MFISQGVSFMGNLIQKNFESVAMKRVPRRSDSQGNFRSEGRNFYHGFLSRQVRGGNHGRFGLP